MISQSIKYLLLVVLLHLTVTSCNIPHEIARLDYSQYGCFGGYTAELLIYKQHGEIMARVEYDKKHKRTVQISQAQLDFLFQFIDELKKIREADGCLSTTSIKYRVVRNGEAFVREPSCGFRNFAVFYKELFAS
jgi:hypothetical protein